jgi:hypothetical protein
MMSFCPMVIGALISVLERIGENISVTGIISCERQ